MSEPTAARPNCPRAQARAFHSRWDVDMSRRITAAVYATYQDEHGVNPADSANMPQSGDVIAIVNDLREVLFPGYTGRHTFSRPGLEFAIGDHLNRVFQDLAEQIEKALAYRCRLESCDDRDCLRQSEDAAIALLERIPAIRETLKSDVQAAMDGDPAAKSTDEVIIAYPGLRAIAIQRIAHELYAAGVPLLPRVMGEYAHSITGIDIHPGATIGPSFFIDHGTGVVIGETAVIGANVKLYQGVTLGALSFPKDESGRLIKGRKRHPNLEDNVTVYAGATILGDITIGHDSVIGGNVWLTESVPPYTKVLIAPPELSIRTRPPAA